jgi:hypothetical protein
MAHDLKTAWEIWDQKNPDFYKLFKQFTFEAIKSGKTKLSAWLIVNRIRWESEIVTVGNKYKISNDFIALYSRKFMQDFPEHNQLFTTKEMWRA